MWFFFSHGALAQDNHTFPQHLTLGDLGPKFLTGMASIYHNTLNMSWIISNHKFCCAISQATSPHSRLRLRVVSNGFVACACSDNDAEPSTALYQEQPEAEAVVHPSSKRATHVPPGQRLTTSRCPSYGTTSSRRRRNPSSRISSPRSPARRPWSWPRLGGSAPSSSSTCQTLPMGHRRTCSSTSRPLTSPSPLPRSRSCPCALAATGSVACSLFWTPEEEMAEEQSRD
jgi:hypothetical protein